MIKYIQTYVGLQEGDCDTKPSVMLDMQGRQCQLAVDWLWTFSPLPHTDLKAGRRSVYRAANVLHHSVKLLRLVGVHVVRGIIYQLHKDTEKKKRKVSPQLVSYHTINNYELIDTK